MVGPTLEISKIIHEQKYRNRGETFEEMCERLAETLSDSKEHKDALFEVLADMRFLPGGRIQKDIGSIFATTAFNCFVSGTIEDSFENIMVRLAEAAETMRRGGGIGYDFSTLRPRGDAIRTLNSRSSGPVSFMDIFDALCGTIQSAGHRRGAQMGVLRVDHPDIIEFIRAKHTDNHLTRFNVSVAVTDEFMKAVKDDAAYWTQFNGQKYGRLKAKKVWDLIMKSTWDQAEPGVLFIDRINQQNPLYYCERIATTNPCGEVPLPPYGACLLGSFNITKYIIKKEFPEAYIFDHNKFVSDIRTVVRAMDNVIDETEYPLKAQEKDERAKRRMGLGVTGIANAIELLGASYGSSEYIQKQSEILGVLRNEAYRASVALSAEKGSFELFDADKWLNSGFASTLLPDIRDDIRKVGLRNGLLLSIAPAGTISLCADNISSGIEPPYNLAYNRRISEFNGSKEVEVTDWLWREHGIKSKTSNECSAEDHVDVLTAAQFYIDHAVSKTCNIGSEVTFDRFKDIYLRAYENGAKGITTFREAGKRSGILTNGNNGKKEETTEACKFDPETGSRTCDL